jgi:uncharacterized protein (UPF0332 family)
MLFDWKRFLLLAEELGKRAQDEAALRSAVSRAYYAGYCKARNLLRDEGVTIPTTGPVHVFVWSTYRNASDRRRVSVGTEGDRLRRKRNRADYDDEFSGLEKEVPVALQKAGRLLETLDHLSAQTP